MVHSDQVENETQTMAGGPIREVECQTETLMVESEVQACLEAQEAECQVDFEVMEKEVQTMEKETDV